MFEVVDDALTVIGTPVAATFLRQRGLRQPQGADGACAN
jgi:hypothetical protein